MISPEQLLHAAAVMGLAVSAFFLVVGVFSLSGEALMLFVRRFHRRLTLQSRMAALQALDPLPVNLTEDERFGLDAIPWNTYQWGAGGVGLVFGILLLGNTTMPFLAVLGGVGGYLAPRFFHKQMLDNARWRLRIEVRDFISDLRLAFAMNVTLSVALQEIARRTQSPLLGKALRHREGELLLATDPSDVLEGLSADLGSRDLKELVVRVRAARRGGISFDEALMASADDIAEGIQSETEYAIESAPQELILPMLVVLFPPVILLLLTPLISQLLVVLSGSGLR